MSEFTVRLLVLGLIAGTTAVLVWRHRRVVTTRPHPISRPDLGEGVYFFASSTCRPCVAAREVLAQVYGDNFVEVSYEEDPTRFGRAGIASVPTVLVLGPDGSGLSWEGVPRAGDLPQNLNPGFAAR